MNKLHFTQEQLLQVAKLSDADIRIVNECRGEHNKLGFASQLCYVKLFNRLPMQRPLELLDELADKIPYSIFTDESGCTPNTRKQMEKFRNGLMLIKDSGSISHLLKSLLIGIIIDLMEV
ncbi:MAG: DUF4158 domain-containing protein [ANME-2 cluster archaeon]|nr:MAG: DUF4158 domain-containing protein [ANME-2 cluster archaeon]